MTAPPEGSFGTVRTNTFLGRGIRFVTRSPVSHAFVYIGNGRIIEAARRGARLARVDEYDNIYWCPPPTEMRGLLTALAACDLVGTRYAYLDILTVGLLQYHVRPPLLRRFVRWQTRHRLICSQLVDVAASNGGWQLFDDGRDPGDVTPGDLLKLSLRVAHGAR